MLRGKLSDHEVTLLVCDRREENIRILFGEFVKIDVYLLVRLKAIAGDGDDLARRVISFVGGNTRLRATHQLGGVQYLACAVDAAGHQRLIAQRQFRDRLVGAVEKGRLF